MIREGVKAQLGTAAELLDMTPFQILRLLGAKKTPSKPQDWAMNRLRQIQGVVS